MFIEISVVLAGSESAVLFLDEEEGRRLGGFRRADLSRAKVFINEVIGGLSFFYREGIEFSNFWDKGFTEIDGVVVGSRGGYVVRGFFREDLGVLSVFWGQSFLGFLSLGLHGEVCGHSEFINRGGGGRGEELGTTSVDSVDNEGVHSSFREPFWEFCVKVPAKAGLFCGV